MEAPSRFSNQTGLNRAFAKVLFPGQSRSPGDDPADIRNDFRGTGGKFIDQHCHQKITNGILFRFVDSSSTGLEALAGCFCDETITLPTNRSQLTATSSRLPTLSRRSRTKPHSLFLALIAFSSSRSASRVKSQCGYSQSYHPAPFSSLSTALV